MKEVSVLIIGAGSTGLSTALNLAKNKVKNVCVVDMSYVGSGQTGQCCGFVRTYYNTKEMAFMAHESMKYIRKLCKLVPNLNYEKKGLLVFENIKNSQEVKKNITMLNSLGIKAKYVNSNQIKRINPHIITEGICAGFDQDAGYVNPHIMVNYLAEECKYIGVIIKENTKVTGIKRRNNYFIVQTNRETIKAKKVFNATAAFTNKINKMLDFELPVKAINIDNGFYRLPAGPNKYQIAFADFVNHFYLIPHKEFIDVSSIALDLKRVIDPEKHKYDFNYSVVQEYLQLIGKRIKNAEKSASIGGFNSCIDVTPDYYPILSEIDKIPNYYCATGFSGTGFKHFPMVGKLMAELIMGKKPKILKFFRYDRFTKGKIRKGVSDSYFVKE